MLHPAWMNAMNVSTKIARRFSALRTAFSFARFMQQLKRWGPRNSSVTVERAVQAEYVANAMLDPRTPFATVVLASVGLPGDPESRGCFKPVLAEYIRRHFDIFPTRLVSNTARSHAWSLVRSTGTALNGRSNGGGGPAPPTVSSSTPPPTPPPPYNESIRPASPQPSTLMMTVDDTSTLPPPSPDKDHYPPASPRQRAPPSPSQPPHQQKKPRY
ncbi:uncharacterized protein LOC105283978 [Ooceraea biroi]|uniref:uncharacterized protein LOC105283978 n=1 Tax=Ooceraea biroi TaxID=2015173 RepID=UPI0005BE37C7|nr:uncharacterized protein LOC105283978 [Ooceraea biroi]